MFAYATGPLAWSIVAFRNSMVFHSLDKVQLPNSPKLNPPPLRDPAVALPRSPRGAETVRSKPRNHVPIFEEPRAPQMTSLLLHWMPACVVWTLRWYPHRSVRLNFAAKSEDSQADWHHGSTLQLVLIPFLPYLAWAAAYYVKVRRGAAHGRGRPVCLCMRALARGRACFNTDTRQRVLCGLPVSPVLDRLSAQFCLLFDLLSDQFAKHWRPRSAAGSRRKRHSHWLRCTRMRVLCCAADFCCVEQEDPAARLRGDPLSGFFPFQGFVPKPQCLQPQAL